MVAPPTFVTEYESTWNVNTTPKTASVTVNTGDVLVIVGVTADQSSTLNTPTGGGLTYTLQQSIEIGSNCAVYIWTAIAASSQTFTLSCSRTATANLWGFNCLRFSGSDGVGNSAKTNTTGAPTLNITEGTANSAVVVVVGDWNAVDGTTRTWRTNAGALTEQTYFRDSVNYTVYAGYHADAGTATTDAVGLSAPTGQKYSIIAVEVKGSASSTQNIVLQLLSVTSTLFDPKIILIISSNLISSPSTIFNPGVVPGPVVILPTLVSVPSTLYNLDVINGNIAASLISSPSTIFDPTIVNLLSIVSMLLLSAPSVVYNLTVSGGGIHMAVGSIADKARANMITDRSLSEPVKLSNTDLMGVVLADGAQTLVVKTNAATATQLVRYMMGLR